MLTHDQFETISDSLIPRTQELEASIIHKITALIATNIQLTHEQLMKIQKLRDEGFSDSQIAIKMKEEFYTQQKLKNLAESRNELRKHIEQEKKNYAKDIAELCLVAATLVKKFSLANDTEIYLKAKKQLKENKEANTISKKFSKDLAKQTTELAKSSGFVGISGKESIMRFYQKHLDLSIRAVTTGSMTVDQAVVQCIEILAQSGLKTIDYATGVHRQIDTAVRQSTLYGSKQSTAEITKSNAEVMGTTIFEFDVHGGARPTHQFWQGKRFDTTGKYYPTRQDLTKGQDQDYGCLHSYFPVPDRHAPFAFSKEMIHDLEPKPFTYEGKTYNGYQAKTQQRYLERKIRAQKRKINELNNMGIMTPEEKTKLKKLRANYIDFCKAADTYPKFNRIRVLD